MSRPARSLKRPQSLDLLTTTSTEALQPNATLFHSTNQLSSSHEKQEKEKEKETETNYFTPMLSNMTLQSSRESFHSVSSMDVDDNVSPDSAIVIPHHSFYHFLNYHEHHHQQQQQVHEDVLINRSNTVAFEPHCHSIGSEHTSQNLVTHDAPVPAHMTNNDENKEEEEKEKGNVNEIFPQAKQNNLLRSPKN